MKYILTLVIIVITSLTTGCAATDNTDTVNYNNDPRVGDSIDRVCFNKSISGWSDVDNDNSALLVHFGVNRSYKVKLVGMCESNWAMTRIAVVSRLGSSCMSTGDKIVTDAQLGSCTITDIFEWHAQPNDKETANN